MRKVIVSKEDFKKGAVVKGIDKATFKTLQVECVEESKGLEIIRNSGVRTIDRVVIVPENALTIYPQEIKAHLKKGEHSFVKYQSSALRDDTGESVNLKEQKELGKAREITIHLARIDDSKEWVFENVYVASFEDSATDMKEPVELLLV